MAKKEKNTIYQLDEIDLKILTHLSNSSKTSLNQLSNILGIPVSTVFARIKKLEEKGIIDKYTLSVDPKKLGFNVTAIINFSVEGSHIEEFEKQISNHPNVLFLYDITGDFDVIAVTRFRNIEELDYFIKNVLKNPYVKRTITNIALRVVKESYLHVPLLIE
ncbi:Lrp/AsnC family transcriptional regulator [Fervidicoccus sp.]|uniref:Lrp/AsnC family transcriptional regulator n=1 Tax=Fervidicoccus sp. TaxID=2060324 RepID=UPI003D138C68